MPTFRTTRPYTDDLILTLAAYDANPEVTIEPPNGPIVFVHPPGEAAMLLTYGTTDPAELYFLRAWTSQDVPLIEELP